MGLAIAPTKKIRNRKSPGKKKKKEWVRKERNMTLGV